MFFAISSGGSAGASGAGAGAGAGTAVAAGTIAGMGIATAVVVGALGLIAIVAAVDAFEDDDDDNVKLPFDSNVDKENFEKIKNALSEWDEVIEIRNCPYSKIVFSG